MLLRRRLVDDNDFVTSTTTTTTTTTIVSMTDIILSCTEVPKMAANYATWEMTENKKNIIRYVLQR